MELAHYCRTAINFGKHGKDYVDREEMLDAIYLLNNIYPDFMEKTDRPSIPTRGVLGTLYRQVRFKEIRAID